METWSIVLALAAVALAIYYYTVRGIAKYKKHGIPYQTPVPLLGNFWPTFFRLKSFAEIVKESYDTHHTAKYVGMMDLMTPVTLIRDGDLIKQVTVKHFEHFINHRGFVDDTVEPLFGKNLFALEGDRWKEVRAIISPTFTSSKMKAMFKLMQECAVYFTSYLANLPKDPTGMDIKDVFTRYTNDVIATCAFGISINSMKDRKNAFYVYGREATTFDGWSTILFFLMRSAPSVSKALKLRLIRQPIADFFTEIVANTIKTRDEKGITRPDMIQLMMETRGKLGEGKELTIEDMTAQAFVFFFGGFESTSTLMCFAAHEIAVNPDVQERLQAEIDGVLNDTNGEVTYEAINDMKYMDAVVNEALRMYPIVVAADRVCNKDFELPPALPGAKPYTVRKNDIVWIPIYGLHRDKNYFEDPDKFIPDRFLEDPKKIANSGVYLPFGIGPRMCIGNRFALLETKCLLFNLLARCDMKPCAKTGIPLRLNRKGLSMTAHNGFWLTVEKRSKVHPSIEACLQNGAANGVANGVAK